MGQNKKNDEKRIFFAQSFGSSNKSRTFASQLRNNATTNNKAKQENKNLTA